MNRIIFLIFLLLNTRCHERMKRENSSLDYFLDLEDYTLTPQRIMGLTKVYPHVKMLKKAENTSVIKIYTGENSSKILEYSKVDSMWFSQSNDTEAGITLLIDTWIDKEKISLICYEEAGKLIHYIFERKKGEDKGIYYTFGNQSLYYNVFEDIEKSIVNAKCSIIEKYHFTPQGKTVTKYDSCRNDTSEYHYNLTYKSQIMFWNDNRKKKRKSGVPPRE